MEIPAIVGGGLVVIGVGIGIGSIGKVQWRQSEDSLTPQEKFKQ